MQFDNIEKFRTKVDSSYLLVGTEKGPSLCWVRSTDGWGLGVTTLSGHSEFIEDVRNTGRIVFKSPPVGYLNSSSLKCAVVLTRIPIRSFKVGLTNDNTSVKVVCQNGKMGYRLGDVLNDDDYPKLLKGSYPSYDEMVAFLREGKASCALGVSSAIKLNAFGIPILEVGGYNVGWWAGSTFRVLEGAKKEVVSKALKLNLDELGEVLRNV